MNALNRWFKKSQTENQSNFDNNKFEIIRNDKEETLKKTYSEAGYQLCIDTNASLATLTLHMNQNYERFVHECERDKEMQDILWAPRERQKQQLELNIKAAETRKAILEDSKKIKEEEQSNAQAKEEDVWHNPGKYLPNIDGPQSKLRMIIGIIILIPLTVFLFIFYINVSYQAFFMKEIATNKLISIMNGFAIGSAIEAGPLALIFVITIPFAFLGLGYLIHVFQKESKSGRIKVIALFAVTLIYDFILAYEIEKHVYDQTKTMLDAPFNFIIAFQTPSFWTIIFAGFVTYIIWGLVFDFIMNENDKLHPLRKFSDQQKQIIDRIKNEINDLKEKINSENTNINKYKSDIIKIGSREDKTITPVDLYRLVHFEFVTGFSRALSQRIALPDEEKESKHSQIAKLSNEHLSRTPNTDFE